MRVLPPVLIALALAAVPQAHADRLGPAQEIARGDLLAPRFAPDGRALVASGSKLRGLFLLADGAVRKLTDDAGAGVHAQFTPAGEVRYRAFRAGARRDLIVSPDGRVRSASPAPAPVAFARDDRMYAVSPAGTIVRVGSGDRFFGEVVAPDGDRVAFQGLATGLYVYTRSTGALVHVGPGTAPAWSPDSSRLLFEVTEDDGHEVIASDIYVYRVAQDRVERLTSTDTVVERRPTFSPDGRRVAFDDDRGAILVAPLEVAP